MESIYAKENIFHTQSKYCYDGTNILINKEDIKNQEELDHLEGLISTFKLSKLNVESLSSEFDVRHYKGIHKYIFEDIYYFAGKFRNEDINKRRIMFCNPRFIKDQLQNLLSSLKRKTNENLSYDEFLDILIYHYTELYMVHPFREGNSRTEREYFREYVLYFTKFLNIGQHELDYSSLSCSDLENFRYATELSAAGREQGLTDLFEKCLTKK